MEQDNVKRVRLLRIWEILQQETDDEHPMGTPELLARLQEGGIECDRRTLYRDIKTLNNFGYEIFCKRSTTNCYYVVDRAFSVPEIQILMDAVQAANFITEEKTAELINRLSRLAGSQRGAVLRQNIVFFNVPKASNKSVLYSVNEIAAAITKKKKVKFQYFDFDEQHRRVYRKDSAFYVMNPVATVYDEEKYYLICYDDKHGTLAQYRIDRMDKVEMLPEPIAKTEKSKRFDVKKHRKQLFGMYVGEPQKVTLEADKTLIDLLFDKFGDDISLASSGNNKVIFTTEVQISPVFIAWCAAFGDRLKVHGPENIVDMVKEYLATTIKQYNQEDKK